jgi:HD-GYP domain-containing protein (c-di-GMP phosphodiesterase class II)
MDRLRLKGNTMRLTTALVCITLLTTGCSREQEDARPALERAQEKLQASIDEAEARLAEGTAQAKQALAAAMERWEKEIRPEAEKAIASLEERVEMLVSDSEALKRLPPDALERVRKRLEAMREKLAQAKAARQQGNVDLAVEKADAIQQDRAAAEELLVERPDPPSHHPEGQ